MLLKPVPKLLGRVGGGRVPFARAWVVVPEIGNEDAVSGTAGEDVGTLEGLGVVAEDISDNEDTGSCRRGTSDVW
jgi:hypothetical protein